MHRYVYFHRCFHLGQQKIHQMLSMSKTETKSVKIESTILAYAYLYLEQAFKSGDLSKLPKDSTRLGSQNIY